MLCVYWIALQPLSRLFTTINNTVLFSSVFLPTITKKFHPLLHLLENEVPPTNFCSPKREMNAEKILHLASALEAG